MFLVGSGHSHRNGRIMTITMVFHTVRHKTWGHLSEYVGIEYRHTGSQ